MTSTILRHRTAISRKKLSTPMRALQQFGFLSGDLTAFDYGCGKGDDVKALTEAGIQINCWDPHFAPSNDKIKSDVVNIGFVINVIEDEEERANTLKDVFSLASVVLAVSSRCPTKKTIGKYEPYLDGVITKAKTFQKYHTHAELGEYIESVLGKHPVSVGKGLYFVFPDDAKARAFILANKSKLYKGLSAR